MKADHEFTRIFTNHINFGLSIQVFSIAPGFQPEEPETQRTAALAQLLKKVLSIELQLKLFGTTILSLSAEAIA